MGVLLPQSLAVANPKMHIFNETQLSTFSHFAVILTVKVAILAKWLQKMGLCGIIYFMKIKRLELQNFRNYEHQVVEFQDGLNVLIGKNAQGKTNLVEAINFCCIGKSHRTSRERELISFDKDKAKIKVVCEKFAGEKTVEILLSKTDKKIIRINGMSILRIGELFGNINAVFFSPDDLKLVKESPLDRRKFLDIDLSQMSKVYFYNLLRYEKILAQRNKLLKDCFDKTVAKAGVDVWNEQLAQVGAKIIFARHNFACNLNCIAHDLHARLTDNAEDLQISYTGIDGFDVDDVYRKLYAALNASIDKDLALGYTTIGPHRDDLKIMCNGIDLRSFGSQGQQRTSALSLKLAELEIFKDEIGEYPVLILDDVLSELDDGRCNKLLSNISNVQTILTGTSFSYPFKAAHYTINDGKIITPNN